MDKDLVSIIIPTYNRASYLVNAVESCIVQVYEHLEIIIIDDGSTDDTEIVIKSHLDTDWGHYNITYHKQKNAGASSARNHGLQIARGTYIQFLDSDDILFKEKIVIQLSMILENRLDGCSCLGYMGTALDFQTSETIGEPFSSVQSLIENLCNGVHVMQTSAPIWKKDVLLKVKGWNEDIGFGDDLEYHIKVLLKVNKFEFLNRHLFWLRVHDKERLSDASKSPEVILSGIRTQQSITVLLKNSSFWGESIRNGIVAQCRTLYVNLIQYNKKPAVLEFERWLFKILKLGKSEIIFLFIIGLRKILGAKFTFEILNKVLKIYTK
ncbi:MAG: glycosyltransferase family A protein [Psychroserpens sp.]|uniref:glycosyltransferase family 2 protein n=1 Tax=Psychroserpens sp. TaxID=2020870 RepID=UPI003CB91EA4